MSFNVTVTADFASAPSSEMIRGIVVQLDCLVADSSEAHS
jgi:hypothetical protein